MKTMHTAPGLRFDAVPDFLAGINGAEPRLLKPWLQLPFVFDSTAIRLQRATTIPRPTFRPYGVSKIILFLLF